jgi:hypothetical protein
MSAFGVAVYPFDLPPEFSEMEGTREDDHRNFGNYIYTSSNGDQSVLVFIPKFFFKTSDDCESIDISFEPKEGYRVHRAFLDGGEEKSGFFIDKYVASKSSDNKSCVSKFGGVPISLTTNTEYTASYDMPGCKGTLEDSIVLATSRGPGFNVASIFMYDAMAKLAWFRVQDPSIKEYWKLKDNGLIGLPRGCNSNLSDYYDPEVRYESAGDIGDKNKPKTGAIACFEKTTHNGHASGVADLNGVILQCMLGVTTFDNSKTAYVIKESEKLADLIHPWDNKDPYEAHDDFFL